MTDIDPAADIELHTVDEHVIVRVPLAGPVTEEWVLYYQRLARATGVLYQTLILASVIGELLPRINPDFFIRSDAMMLS